MSNPFNLIKLVKKKLPGSRFYWTPNSYFCFDISNCNISDVFRLINELENYGIECDFKRLPNKTFLLIKIES